MIQEHYDMKLEDEKKTTEADDSTGDYIRQYENEVDCLEFKINSEQDRLEVQSFPSPVEANAFWTDAVTDRDNSWTRVLSKSLKEPPSIGSNFEFPQDVTATISLKDEARSISVTESTGTVAFKVAPKTQFKLQTPLDNGPFVSLTIHHATDFNFTALYLHSSPIFSPVRIMQDQMWLLRWRWCHLPVVLLPIAFAHAHDVYVGQCIDALHSELAAIETSLLTPSTTTTNPSTSASRLDFSALTLRLHTFSTSLLNLSRRAHFQDTLLSTILSTTRSLEPDYSTHIHLARLATLEKAMESRRYDLESFPKREQTARATIFNLTIQRDQAISLQTARANLEIAQNSQRIAEATMRDSKAMKTIAILTMLFLPGTAVASFFSITMFNWTPQANGNGTGGGEGVVASKYVWVYFVVAVPLTVLVLGIWWFWHRRRDTPTLRRRWKMEEEDGEVQI